MNSGGMARHKGTNRGRMRSAAAGEHRTGEGVGEAFTLGTGQDAAMRRIKASRRQINHRQRSNASAAYSNDINAHDPAQRVVIYRSAAAHCSARGAQRGLVVA
jgi:hypothetical protein